MGNSPRRYRHLYDSRDSSGFESSDALRAVVVASTDYAVSKVMSVEVHNSTVYH